MYLIAHDPGEKVHEYKSSSQAEPGCRGIKIWANGDRTTNGLCKFCGVKELPMMLTAGECAGQCCKCGANTPQTTRGRRYLWDRLNNEARCGQVPGRQAGGRGLAMMPLAGDETMRQVWQSATE